MYGVSIGIILRTNACRTDLLHRASHQRYAQRIYSGLMLEIVNATDCTREMALEPPVKMVRKRDIVSEEREKPIIGQRGRD